MAAEKVKLLTERIEQYKGRMRAMKKREEDKAKEVVMLKEVRVCVRVCVPHCPRARRLTRACDCPNRSCARRKSCSIAWPRIRPRAGGYQACS